MKKVDVREKLIESIEEAYYCSIEELADHLIANGVTLNVRDCHWATEQAYKNGYKQGKQDAVVHGLWETIDGREWLGCLCTNCNKWSDARTKYCPNCGAKMDGHETKSSVISQRTVQALERMGQKVHGGEDA
jgi:hypothetical protein